MSMDTTFHDKDLMWCAITSVALYHVAYVGIIAWESATAVVCWVATVLGTRSLRASTSFARALKVSVLGLLMSTLLWAGPLQQESKALTRVRSQIREPAISSSRVGTACRFNGYDERCITVGGEWFAMWQSTKWNGEEPALRNFTAAGIALAVVMIVGNDDKRSIDRESS